MKRKILLLVLSAFFVINAQAQIPPQAFNYSAVARDAQSNPIASQTIGIQISILQTTSIGPVVYSENHFVNTDQYGLFNLIIGAGAIQSGSMGTIDWSGDNYYLKVGMDANGGTNFLTMGTTQLISVPYALHAATADSLIGGASITETDPLYATSVASGITAGDTTSWNADIDPNNELQTISISNDTIYLSNGGFAVLPANASGGKSHLILTGDITDAQAAAKIQNDVGPNTQFVTIKNTTSLTNVDLSNISELVILQIFNNSALNTLNLSNLVSVYDNFSIENNPILNTVSLSNLQGVYENLSINDNPLFSNGLSFSSIQFWPSVNTTIGNNGFSTLTFSNLTQNSAPLNISNNSSLTSVSFPSLTSSTHLISISSNSQLSVVSMPNLTYIDSAGINIIGNSSLTNIDLSSLNDIVSSNGSFFYFSSNQLSSANVNQILNIFVNSITPVTSGWLFLNGQAPLAPPTGQGLTDKATLQSLGVNVFTD